MRRFLFIGVFGIALLVTALLPTFSSSQEQAPPPAPAPAGAPAPAAPQAPPAPEAATAGAPAPAPGPEAAAAAGAPPPTGPAPAMPQELAFLGKAVANLANGKKIFQEGKGEAPACMSCHGDHGLGDDNMGTPRLAGQGFQYLHKQLHDFAHDARTDTTMGVMNTVAKSLTEQDRLDITSYESSIKQPAQAAASDMQAVKDGGATPVGERYLGKGIVFSGIPKQGVPACMSCHQYNGRGAPPVYPSIGGQRYVYLVNQLQKWRDGSRANDPLGQMRAVAKNLKDEDIYNVATYLTSAPPHALGNPGVPEYYVPAIANQERRH